MNFIIYKEVTVAHMEKAISSNFEADFFYDYKHNEFKFRMK